VKKRIFKDRHTSLLALRGGGGGHFGYDSNELLDPLLLHSGPSAETAVSSHTGSFSGYIRKSFVPFSLLDIPNVS
jgi:hypothetical protein